MPTIPSGVQKIVTYAKETTWGTQASGTGQSLRRTSAEINLQRQSFTATEITSTAQTSDMRLGVRKVTGQLKGEVSPAAYKDFLASLLRSTWTAGVSVTGTTYSANATTGVFGASSGSFLTSGFMVGDLVQVSGFVNGGNNGYFTVTAVTATSLTVDNSASTMVTEAAGASVTIAVSGKKVFTPVAAASRTDDSYTIEQWYQGVSVSEVALGCKIAKASFSIQPNAMASVDFEIMGANMTTSGTQQYPSATSPTTNGLLSGNSGALYVGGTKVATVTGLTFDITGNMQEGEVAFAQVAAGIFLGRVTASGQFTAYFTDNTLWTQFANETETTLVFRLDGSTSGQSMVFKFPRIKLGGATKDDKEVGGIIQTVPFTALLYSGTGPYENTTVVIQDTTA